MSFDKGNPLLLQSAPTLWIQDRKDGNVGGGHYTTADTRVVRDLTWIGKNTITGAGIKPDNTTLHTAKGYMVGDVGKSTIINNPSSGVNNTLSKFVLPVGEYFVKYYSYFHTNNYYQVIRNVTDAVDEITSFDTYPSNSYSIVEGFFDVTGSTKEFELIGMGNSPSDVPAGLGQNNLPATYPMAHVDIKIYKLG